MSPMVRLRPAARPVRRGVGEVQFGLSPGHGIVLAGLTDPEADLLLSLAGSAGTSRDAALAARFGVPIERVDELISALRSHGLLVDPGHQAGPGTAAVCVPGRGTVVDLLREQVRTASVGRLVPDDHVPEAGTVDLVLLCALDAVSPDEGRAWQQTETPHLPVVLRNGDVVIGPLVQPGRSACLRCLDLHRCDRDRAWPRILTQIITPTTDLGHAIDAPPTHAATIAALVTMIALECLGRPESVLGVSWQVSLPWPDVHTRVWARHPMCDCAVRPGPD